MLRRVLLVIAAVCAHFVPSYQFSAGNALPAPTLARSLPTSRGGMCGRGAGGALGVRMQAEEGPISRRRLGQIGLAALGIAGSRKLIAGGVYAETPDLSGKVAIVTGGNTGIGKETAVRLAEMGAEVVLGCRSSKRGQAAVDEIKQRTGSKLVSSMPLDLSSLNSVRAFATQFSSEHKMLYALVNNAGVMALPERQRSADGFEKQLAINHLGHFELTKQLMPLLVEAGKKGDARVVCVSSDAHRLVFSDPLEDLNSEKTYQPWEAYGRSKLANVLFASELSRRLPADSNIHAASLHPGVVRTELGRSFFVPPEACAVIGSVDCTGSMPAVAQVGFALTAPAMAYFTKSPEQGAMTQVRCAADPAFGREMAGKYLSDCHVADPSPLAKDAELAKRLWAASEKMTGSPFVV